MHLRHAARRELKLRKNPRKSWWFNLKEVTVNGEREVTFHLRRPQPSLLTMLAGAYLADLSVPCQRRPDADQADRHRALQVRRAEAERIDQAGEEPRLLEEGPALSRRHRVRIIPSRATSILAFVAGQNDLTFRPNAAPALKDLKTQAPWAQCEMLPTNTQANLLVNRDKPPFDNTQVRRAMVLAIDRYAFTEIIGQGANRLGGAMLPPPEGCGACPADFLATVRATARMSRSGAPKAARSWPGWVTVPTSRSRSRSRPATSRATAIRR